jgi:hypothetical protein
MTFMTKQNEELLQKLVDLAGSASVVETALRELANEQSDAPTIRQLVERILLLRQRSEAITASQSLESVAR